MYTCFINEPIENKSYSDYNNSENKKQIINRIEKKEFYSGVKNNLLFFNLALGMNEKEVENKLLKLKNENILENISCQNGIIGATYTMSYHEYSNIGRVYCFFNDNKLKELQIDTLNQNNNLLDLFIEKYGKATYLAENEGNTEYHWINGNRHLTILQIESSNRLLIQFVDTTEKVKELNENIFDKLGVYYKA
jgi:hypothetical protein